MQYSQLVSLRPRSSMSCQAQISHSVSGHVVRDKFGHVVPLSHSFSGCAAQIILWVSQLLLESSLQSSCPLFLKRAQLFTQPNFPPVQRLSKSVSDSSQLLPNPPFSRCHPQFLWCQCPQSQQICTASVCLPLHLYSPRDFQHPGPFWC